MSGELPQTGIGWIRILGISDVVSGGVSAAINYILTMHEFRKKTEMDFIRQKLDLYSSIIYHLDKMKYANEAIDFAHYKNQPKQERFVYIVIENGKN